jgi:glyoxylase-like metal-dependent hydrolase (beta-lactamase superfamily II)
MSHPVSGFRVRVQRRQIILNVVVVAVALAAMSFAARAEQAGASRATGAPSTVRLYVLDGGTLNNADMSRYRLKPEEVSSTKMSVAAFLIVHPRGTLMWDTGAVPDDAWKPTGQPVMQHLVLPDGQMREVEITRPLLPQLMAAGYSPSAVTYLALSHDHWDHTANANAFARSTWITRTVERDAMFVAKPIGLVRPETYASLRNAKTKLLDDADYDVFGDGSVVMKLAPGHTPGHQVLFVRLAHTGNIVLSGDLYHYPAERALGRVPTFDVDQAQTRASRAAIDAFLTRTHAQLWIQHDFVANAKLKKAPAFYD